ncbi:MAG TPA: hypothetical protein VFV99_17645 [Kofleriaceae bacterium]|nr:hypothetical protein [Kofleriaceae bacterium]
MTALVPCPACKRHVATRERACPFCAHVLPVARAQHITVIGRVTRAAVFSAALVACGKDKPKEAPAPPPAQGSDDLEKMLDEPRTVEHAAVPPPVDAAVIEPDAAVVDAGAPPDAGVVKKKHVQKQQVQDVRDIKIDHIQNAKPYGAPPARRRIV